MIATLGMYDRPEIAAANDALWVLIRDGLAARGLPAPHALTRGDAAYWPAWLAGDLVLSQTCGLPFRSRLHDHVTLIGTPDYGLPDCPPGYYRSVLVARADDPRRSEAEFRTARFAFNDPLSQSGWSAPFQHFHDLGLTLTPALETGSHRESARAVADGRADLAALDAISWDILCRFESFASALRVVAQTRPTPGLPLIAAKGTDAAAMFEVVSAAIADLDATHRQMLRLQGLVRIPARHYLSLALPPEPVIAQIGGIA
jgi:ABC-type phosphate/phosphonate transport system substrate-binding protein